MNIVTAFKVHHRPTATTGLLTAGLAISLCLLLTGCSLGPDHQPTANGPTHPITDMAGRTVTVPDKINKVYSASPPGAIMLYTLDPDKLAGWNYYMASQEVKYLVDKYRQLPVLGGWFGKNNTGSIEEVLKLKPDIIICAGMGSVTKADIDLANQITQQSGIPAVVVDASTNKMAEAYEFIGRLINCEERAGQLAAYCRDTLREAAEGRAKIVNRKRVYYAEGPKGLQTEAAASAHAEVINLVGATNVAGSDLPVGDRGQVSLEQVIAWDPEVILVGFYVEGEYSSYDQLFSDEKWRPIKAIQNHQVFEIPNSPFNWLDRPPSVNRLIGIKWLANLLYPDIYPMDIRSEIKNFYHLFYHYDLTEQEVDDILRRSANP